MAENLQKKPHKGILKNSKSFDHQEKQPREARKSCSKETKWDEMNIIATLHPPDKDYGHMKIDEPKTPYHSYDQPDSSHKIDPDTLAKKLLSDKPPKVMEEDENDEEEDEDADLTEEEKALKKDFEIKRKKHYNEYYAVKLARKLLEEEDDEDTESEDVAGSSSKKK